MSFLQVKNLSKSFGQTRILKGMDFSLEKGEVVSVIGSSGSGKTTFLRCLDFLERASTGTITLGGREIFNAEKKYSDKELRKNRLGFGLVFQNFNLFPQYTAMQNVRLALDLQTKEKLRAEGRSFKHIKGVMQENEAIAKELLSSVGLGEKLNEYPCRLSGGQCQRVAIARALALKPQILCFDEPTSALDPELTGEVLRVIMNLKSSDRAMIIVTHEMQFARDISDRVVFMCDGVIEEQGTPEEIFSAPRSEKTQSFLKNYLRG